MKMPVHSTSGGGYQWGSHGKKYYGKGAKAKAARQGRAAYANGYRGEDSRDESLLQEDCEYEIRERLNLSASDASAVHEILEQEPALSDEDLVPEIAVYAMSHLGMNSDQASQFASDVLHIRDSVREDELPPDHLEARISPNFVECPNCGTETYESELTSNGCSECDPDYTEQDPDSLLKVQLRDAANGPPHQYESLQTTSPDHYEGSGYDTPDNPFTRPGTDMAVFTNSDDETDPRNGQVVRVLHVINPRVLAVAWPDTGYGKALLSDLRPVTEMHLEMQMLLEGDIHCPMCGEPWDTDSVREVAREKGISTSDQINRFNALGCSSMKSQAFGPKVGCDPNSLGYRDPQLLGGKFPIGNEDEFYRAFESRQLSRDTARVGLRVQTDSTLGPDADHGEITKVNDKGCTVRYDDGYSFDYTFVGQGTDADREIYVDESRVPRYSDKLRNLRESVEPQEIFYGMQEPITAPGHDGSYADVTFKCPFCKTTYIGAGHHTYEDCPESTRVYAYNPTLSSEGSRPAGRPD